MRDVGTAPDEANELVRLSDMPLMMAPSDVGLKGWTNVPGTAQSASTLTKDFLTSSLIYNPVIQTISNLHFQVATTAGVTNTQGNFFGIYNLAGTSLLGNSFNTISTTLANNTIFATAGAFATAALVTPISNLAIGWYRVGLLCKYTTAPTLYAYVMPKFTNFKGSGIAPVIVSSAAQTTTNTLPATMTAYNSTSASMPWVGMS